MKPTQQQLNWYRTGRYTLAVPDVTTGQWTEDSWAMWVNPYKPSHDQPRYNEACAVLVSTDPMDERQVRRCRKICARFLKRIRLYGTRTQVKDFMYHMSFVNYPLVKRPNGRWV